MNQEITLADVLEAISLLSTKMDGRFDKLEKELRGEINSVKAELCEFKLEVRQKFLEIDQKFLEIDQRLSSIEVRLSSIEQELDRMNVRLDAISKRTKEDTNVNSQDILELRTRVKKLEKEMQQLQCSSGL